MIYDSDDALVRFQEIFPITLNSDPRETEKVTVRYYRLPDSTDESVVMLKSLNKNRFQTIIVDCSLQNTEKLLKNTYRLGMNNEYHVCIKKITKNSKLI